MVSDPELVEGEFTSRSIRPQLSAKADDGANMTKLWQKSKKNTLDTTIEAFETKEDLLLDQKLVKYDLYGTVAHAMGLRKAGILSAEELGSIKLGLKRMEKQYENQEFSLKLGDEDVHTKIENYLSKRFGEVGKKVHTGRSRNDQVLTALRLYMKDQLLVISSSLLDLANSFLEFAKQYEFTPMPGYTHMQKAMPSSAGMWAGSFVESLLDDLKQLENALTLCDQSPLGGAAGYGVPLLLDREFTAQLLGFSKVQINSLYCQNSRGKTEATTLSSLISVLMTINKFASDVLLFTTSEFNYFTVNEKITTGSSIMPQKKNVDVAELLRSKVHIVMGNYTQVVSLSGNLPSGYNRDLQDSKRPLMESLEITGKCLAVAKILAENITPNVKVLEKAMTPELFATHQALKMVKEGNSFREAYRIVGTESMSKQVLPHVLAILKLSKHIGGTGNLGLDIISLELKKKKAHFKNLLLKHRRALNNLL